MKPETAEWLDKAEGDWKVAQREMQAPDPVWNVVCFLAEQCAEKYLKGFLEEQNIAFQKIHDLVVLLNASTGLLPALDPLKPQLAHLSKAELPAERSTSTISYENIWGSPLITAMWFGLIVPSLVLQRSTLVIESACKRT
jgi:HEPN domain-containing protein